MEHIHIHSDIKNAIYPLVFFYINGMFAEKESKCVIEEHLPLYSLICVIRESQTSKLEDPILYCEQSEATHPTNLFYLS